MANKDPFREIEEAYLIDVNNGEYRKLLSIQIHPTVKIIYKDKEITQEELIQVIEKSTFKK